MYGSSGSEQFVPVNAPNTETWLGRRVPRGHKSAENDAAVLNILFMVWRLETRQLDRSWSNDVASWNMEAAKNSLLGFQAANG